MARFRDALRGSGLGAIAEVKRRSPSAGDLRPDADPAQLAAGFVSAGAAAVSILVDERFGGSVGDVRAARSVTSAPLLAKGFFREKAELDELKQAGADAVLLLLRDLDDRRAAAMLSRATELGLDALVEAHDADELTRAVGLGAEVIGVNARDLDTFAIDRGAALELVASVFAKLRELFARPLVKVCGLTREQDVAVAAEAGADLAGFILARETPRRAPAVLPVPETMLSVAVYVGERGDAPSDLAQLYAREDGHRARDGVLLRGKEQVARVVDRAWQQEDPEHIERARAAGGRIVLAGGLTPDNVGEAIEAVRPWAVDASSSLETEPGIKDHDRVRAFVAAAR